MVGQITGGSPAATGIYYDDTFNRALLPAGTTSCAGKKPGAEVDYTEDLDRDKHSIDAGQGLRNLPDGVMNMTGKPASLIDPAKLPVDPKTCKPVYPHRYLKVNTLFEVAHRAGLRTAWSDKHPAYEMLGGPSGKGLDDLFAPEINSQVPGAAEGTDWSMNNAATQRYDAYKSHAVRNEIDGKEHSGRITTGMPGVFGMNFQSVSTAQKLPVSSGKAGGYLADGKTPGPVLAGALDFVNAQVGSMLTELRKQHHDRDTTVILSAKHGQSPMDPDALRRIDEGPLLDGLNSAWRAKHPGSADLVAHSTDDDGMLLWLSDRSGATFAGDYLRAHSGKGTDINGKPVTAARSGLSTVYTGAAAARYFRVQATDSRVPDVLGIAQHGVVFTGGTGKIAEHGGADPNDRAVPLVLSGGGARVVDTPVATQQIAPTVLRLLGLNPLALKAVREEGTLPLR
jgi:hypothetical protein